MVAACGASFREDESSGCGGALELVALDAESWTRSVSRGEKRYAVFDCELSQAQATIFLEARGSNSLKASPTLRAELVGRDGDRARVPGRSGASGLPFDGARRSRLADQLPMPSMRWPICST